MPLQGIYQVFGYGYQHCFTWQNVSRNDQRTFEDFVFLFWEIFQWNFQGFLKNALTLSVFELENNSLRKTGVEFHQKENGILLRLSANEYNNPPLEMKLLGLKFIADTV